MASEPAAPAVEAHFPALVIVCDASGGVIWIGGATLGRLPPLAASAPRLADLFTRPAAIFLETHVWPLLRHDGQVDEVYLTLRAADGNDLPCLVNARPWATPGGPGFLWLFFPSFERLRFERELLSARAVTQERNRELDTLAHTDPLTGLGNRRALETAFEVMRQRVGSCDSLPSGTLLMVDIDHFKSVNDRWGHDAGDAVLVQLGRALMGCVRRSDTAVRLGGEEFALWLPEATTDAAARVAESVHRSATEVRLPDDASPLTVSIGAAMFGRQSDACDLAQLMKRADEALYKAKASGRNRTVWAGEGFINPVANRS